MHVFVVILLATVVTRTSLQECFQMSSVEGFKLVGHNYKAMNAEDILSCFARCREDLYCQSINYNIQCSMCEANNSTRELQPSHFVNVENWVYFNNHFRALVGSNELLAGKSCKSIRERFPDIYLANQEYWIDPGNKMEPFPVYCDMNTDGGGRTLIASTVINKDNHTIEDMRRETNYRSISNYTMNAVRIDVPSVKQLRELIRFTQLRYHCYQKAAGRTFHIITKKNIFGEKVVEYFTENHKEQATSCDSFFKGPGDTSVLAANCDKWGNGGRWGYYLHNGTYRIYNDPVYWDSDNANKYFINFIPGKLCCDLDKTNCSQLSVGDFWKIYVK